MREKKAFSCRSPCLLRGRWGWVGISLLWLVDCKKGNCSTNLWDPGGLRVPGCSLGILPAALSLLSLPLASQQGLKQKRWHERKPRMSRLVGAK